MKTFDITLVRESDNEVIKKCMIKVLVQAKTIYGAINVIETQKSHYNIQNYNIVSIYESFES